MRRRWVSVSYTHLVILVSLPEHQTAFRRISTVPRLLNEGIEKDIGGMEAPELLADAKAVIEHVREARADELLEKLGDTCLLYTSRCV